MTLTLDQLLATMPHLAKQKERAEAMLPHLNSAMKEAEINTQLRVAAFLAQIGHESFDLTRWVEMAHRNEPVRGCRLCVALAQAAQDRSAPFPGHEAGAQYEGRKDLGNTEAGDGVRYKGMGPIQLTGRANYLAASKALFGPHHDAGDTYLVRYPERAADLDVGFRVAAWFWTSRGLNALADTQDFEVMTRRINGGFNGIEDRRKRYVRALEILQK